MLCLRGLQVERARVLEGNEKAVREKMMSFSQFPFVLYICMGASHTVLPINITWGIDKNNYCVRLFCPNWLESSRGPKILNETVPIIRTSTSVCDDLVAYESRPTHYCGLQIAYSTPGIS